MAKIECQNFNKQEIFNRISIFRLSQLGHSHAEIRKILGAKKSLISKLMKYKKRIHKKMGYQKNFLRNKKNYIW